jgi:hypothetical protein
VTLWVTSVAELPKKVLQALAGYMVPLLTVALVSTSLGVLIMMLGAGSLIFLFWEIGLRPVIREIAPHLPDDLVLRERGLSLGSKLLFLLVSLSLFSGIAVGAASSIHH